MKTTDIFSDSEKAATVDGSIESVCDAAMYRNGKLNDCYASLLVAFFL